MSFEKKLQSLRKASNLSQEELASELGVSRQAVSKWESGVSYPEMDKLILMTKIFKCTLDDLVNDEVDDKSIMKPSESKKEQKYIDSFLEFITKSINMFFSMKFSNLLKCLFELSVLALVLFTITSIIVSIGIGVLEVYSDVYSFNEIAAAIVAFISSFILGLLIALDIIIFFQVYKIRYLDYYDKLIYEYEQDKRKDIRNNIDVVGEEEKDQKEIRTKLKEEKRDRIIIRDPNHRPLAFLSAISHAIVIMFKGFVLCFSFPFIFSLICLIVGIVLAIYLIFTNSVFIGVTLAILGAIVINILILIVVYDFIFNKKVFVKWVFITFIASIFISSIGVGLSLIAFRNIDVVEVNQEHGNIVKETYAYNNDLYFNANEYNRDARYIVDNSLKDKVKVEVEYGSGFYKADLESIDNVINLVYTHKENIGSKQYIDKFLKDLKNNRIEVCYENYYEMITITSSEDNIKNLIKNASKEYNLRVIKGTYEGKTSYNVNYLDTINYGNRACELNDFYYNCVTVETSYEIEPNFKYEFKNGTLIYDKEKYRCNYYGDSKSYSCSLRY